MNMSFQAIMASLGSGLPLLLLHFSTTLALLGVGAAVYNRITPFRERDLIAAGNSAAGLVFGGTLVSLAIPLAATLATSHIWLDIVLWGLVSVLIQMAALLMVGIFFRDFRTSIDQGNVAAASALVGIQIAIALLNAGAMAG